MGKLITNIVELPIEWQKNICRGLRHQIVVPALNIRHEHPSEFPSYLDREIANANAKMLELIEKSSWQGYDLQAISQAYVWNKERKKVLEKMKKKYQAILQKKDQGLTREELKIKLSLYLSEENTNELIKELSVPCLKPRDIKLIYQKYKKGGLKDFGLYLKEFCELAIKFLHKEKQRGWNYSSIKE